MVRQAEEHDMNSTEIKAGEPRGVARGTCQHGSPAGLVGEEPQDMKTEDSKYPGLGSHGWSAGVEWADWQQWSRDADAATGRARSKEAYERERGWKVGEWWRHGHMAERTGGSAA